MISDGLLGLFATEVPFAFRVGLIAIAFILLFWTFLPASARLRAGTTADKLFIGILAVLFFGGVGLLAPIIAFLSIGRYIDWLSGGVFTTFGEQWPELWGEFLVPAMTLACVFVFWASFFKILGYRDQTTRQPK